MAKPLVAIVGRPNVGKSTLFNRLIGKRVSIVEDTPGVTRDRIYGDAEWLDKQFTLIDTGGIEPASEDKIAVQMRRQAELAIERADVIILVTDLRSGVTANDLDVANMLQKSGKPIVLCVNKCDSIGEPPAEFYEFYNLGLGDPFAVSSLHGNGTGDPGYSIKGEFTSNGFQNDLKHTRGVISMARTMVPDSAGAQFFIMHDVAPHLDGEYAAFGMLLEGFDVLSSTSKPSRSIPNTRHSVCFWRALTCWTALQRSRRIAMTCRSSSP